MTSSDNVIRWPSGVETSGWSTSTPSTAASELFDEAAALSRAERRAWLAGHPSAQHLRADVLERVFNSPEDPEDVGRFDQMREMYAATERMLDRAFPGGGTVPRSAAADLGAADGSYRRAVGGRVAADHGSFLLSPVVHRYIIPFTAGWLLGRRRR